MPDWVTGELATYDAEKESVLVESMATHTLLSLSQSMHSQVAHDGRKHAVSSMLYQTCSITSTASAEQ